MHYKYWQPPQVTEVPMGSWVTLSQSSARIPFLHYQPVLVHHWFLLVQLGCWSPTGEVVGYPELWRNPQAKSWMANFQVSPSKLGFSELWSVQVIVQSLFLRAPSACSADLLQVSIVIGSRSFETHISQNLCFLVVLLWSQLLLATAITFLNQYLTTSNNHCSKLFIVKRHIDSPFRFLWNPGGNFVFVDASDLGNGQFQQDTKAGGLRTASAKTTTAGIHRMSPMPSKLVIFCWGILAWTARVRLFCDSWIGWPLFSSFLQNWGTFKGFWCMPNEKTTIWQDPKMLWHSVVFQKAGLLYLWCLWLQKCLLPSRSMKCSDVVAYSRA